MAAMGLYSAFFATSAAASFNGMLWQISRYYEKKETVEAHKNIDREVMTGLPEYGSAWKDVQFRQVEIDGTFDNEGSVIVGPRHVPGTRGAANEEEKRGGFVVMTPFEIAHSGGQFVMVNRGWVPIEAAKNRIFLSRYIGEGFKPATIKGVYRKEEVTKNAFGQESEENFKELSKGLGWFVMRPYEMATAYYGKRWGEENQTAMVKAHGVHRYYVEMTEDYSGNDQRMVNGGAYPRRRDNQELTFVQLLPVVHMGYAAFWGSVCLLSMYLSRQGFRRQQAVTKARKKMMEKTGEVEAQLQKESEEYFQREVQSKLASSAKKE